MIHPASSLWLAGENFLVSPAALDAHCHHAVSNFAATANSAPHLQMGSVCSRFADRLCRLVVLCFLHSLSIAKFSRKSIPASKFYHFFEKAVNP